VVSKKIGQDHKKENNEMGKKIGKIKIACSINPDTVFFFDLDGTLVETNLANFHSYEKAILSVTKSVPNLIYNPNKRFNRSSLKKAIPNLSESEYEKIIQEKEAYYDYFIQETKLNVSIAEILFNYSTTNTTVLVTNCRKDRAIKTLNHFSLMDKFNYIFYRQNTDNKVKINKYKNAISKLEIPTILIVAFEDEKIEIADAIKAGIRTINPLIR
jgi:FMN phosphatase YigB (HAD superfamily)